MGHPTRRETLSGSYPAMSRSNNLTGPPIMAADSDLVWPFGKLHGIDRDDVRETAYEIFFTACRSSPGFGGRNALNFYSNNDNNNNNNGMSSTNNNGDGHNGNCVNGPGLGGGPKQSGHVVTTPTSRVKRALGLKMIKRSPSRRMVSGSSNPSSPGSTVNAGGSPGMSFTVPQLGRARRPMTSAEIMRQQMRVTEQSDNRLRKTLMRTLVGQMGRRAETIILPLELLRHLKPSEFNDSHEYHLWQKRQLKILEAGLLLHPSIPLEKPNTFATRLRDIITRRRVKTYRHRQKLRHNENPLQLRRLAFLAEPQRVNTHRRLSLGRRVPGQRPRLRGTPSVNLRRERRDFSP
ncbi:hypothetical protein F8388_014953 [Cannabis sativa]|uniref:Uncharacterized protein n=1 Tax=Cannabis sativa TaxID=3483 RepID=A0A7J6DWG4_CANSA|nr:hypothetical protein F8388_014953 [Cannabis sativa]